MKSTIIKAAKEGGKILKKYFKKEYAVNYKEGQLCGIVTDADIASEKKILSILKKAFPDYNILSEETGAEERGSPYTWIIDPLDGTQNFVLGLPEFGVAIALAKGKEIIMAVLYFPLFDELYFAEKGKGALLTFLSFFNAEFTPHDALFSLLRLLLQESLRGLSLWDYFLGMLQRLLFLLQRLEELLQG